MLKSFITLCLMYLFSYLSYRVLRFFKIPGPPLVSAILIIGLLTSRGMAWTEPPVYIRLIMQMIIGIMIGTRFNKGILKDLKSLILPGSMITIYMIIAGCFFGLILYHFSYFDFGTSVFCAIPGGTTEMGILALSYGLYVPSIILFQFMRILGVYFVIPIVASRCNNHSKRTGTFTKVNEYVNETEELKNASKEYSILITLLVGLLSGFTAWHLKIPSGSIVGSMFTIGLLRSAGLPLKSLPRRMVLFAQLGLGSILGLRFTPTVVTMLGSILVPSAMMSLVIISNSILLGFIVHKVFKWDIITSLLACAPGGISQISVISLDMNADTVKVSTVHVIRITAIVLLMPLITSWLL